MDFGFVRMKEDGGKRGRGEWVGGRLKVNGIRRDWHGEM